MRRDIPFFVSEEVYDEEVAEEHHAYHRVGDIPVDFPLEGCEGDISGNTQLERRISNYDGS